MELQQHLAEFEALDVRLMAVSYDSAEVLAAFAEHHGIRYPLLSDEGSRVIREYGILNTLVQPDEDVYGIPFPGVYLVGEDGRVQDKLFHRLYQERDTASHLLRLLGGDVPAYDNVPAMTADVDDISVSVQLATPDLKFMQRTELLVTLDLPSALHVNARPLPDGYIPLTVSVTAPEGVHAGDPEYPPGDPFHVDGIDDELNVHTGLVQVVVPLRSDLREGDPVTLEVEVRLQACNEQECFLPHTVRMQITAPIGANASGAPRPPA